MGKPMLSIERGTFRQQKKLALLYAAEFSGRKSQHTLLEALPGLPENVKLLLPGSGALLDDCRAQAASLGVADRTVFPGQVHDMPRWLAAADIAVSSSRSEGLPFNIMEAMACGRPVLATRSGGMPEYLEGSQAVLVERGENIADQLAWSIRMLYEHPALCAEMGAAGVKRAQDFSIARYYDEFVRIVTEIAQNGGTP